MLISNMLIITHIYTLSGPFNYFALFIEVRHLILFHNFEQKNNYSPHIILTFVAMCFVIVR